VRNVSALLRLTTTAKGFAESFVNINKTKPFVGFFPAAPFPVPLLIMRVFGQDASSLPFFGDVLAIPMFLLSALWLLYRLPRPLKLADRLVLGFLFGGFLADLVFVCVVGRAHT